VLGHRTMLFKFHDFAVNVGSHGYGARMKMNLLYPVVMY
jgi:hypothetical protein